MRIKDETAKSINEAYRQLKWHDDLDLRIGISGENVVHGCGCGWEVCKLDELTKTINSLQKMKQAIENTTGFVC